MKATMLAQPVDDLGVLVGSVIVEDEVQLLLRLLVPRNRNSLTVGSRDVDKGFRLLPETRAVN